MYIEVLKQRDTCRNSDKDSNRNEQWEATCEIRVKRIMCMQKSTWTRTGLAPRSHKSYICPSFFIAVMHRNIRVPLSPLQQASANVTLSSLPFPSLQPDGRASFLNADFGKTVKIYSWCLRKRNPLLFYHSQ